jgi:hypothetical protein
LDKAKNLFVVHYASNVWVASLGLTGPFGALVAFLIRLAMGDMLDRGIILADITLDKLKEALKEPQWKEAALKAYKSAIAKPKLSEEEKDVIREQYLDALSKYATYGNGIANG